MLGLYLKLKKMNNPKIPTTSEMFASSDGRVDKYILDTNTCTHVFRNDSMNREIVCSNCELGYHYTLDMVDHANNTVTVNGFVVHLGKPLYEEQ